MARRKSKKKEKPQAPALIFDTKKLKRKFPDSIFVTGQDMGTANYAVTQIEAWVRDGKLKFRVVGTKMMVNLIHDVKVAQNECALFVNEYKALPEADYIAAERYQSRPGGSTGSTVEAISMMLGAMLIMHADTPIDFYTAATWKNAFNRTQADLKSMYEDLATKHKGQGIVIHQIDSFLIALYHAAKVLGVTPFDFIQSFRDEERLFKVLMDAPTL
jgi:hypothetical protein